MLDHGQSQASATSLARTGLSTTYRQAATRCASSMENWLMERRWCKLREMLGDANESPGHGAGNHVGLRCGRVDGRRRRFDRLRHLRTMSRRSKLVRSELELNTPGHDRRIDSNSLARWYFLCYRRFRPTRLVNGGRRGGDLRFAEDGRGHRDVPGAGQA